MVKVEPSAVRSAQTRPASGWQSDSWDHEDDPAACDHARRLLGSGGWTGALSGSGRRLGRLARARWLRIGIVSLVGFLLVFSAGFGILWWRLGMGPINLDVITPWLVSAIEDNLGKEHSVEVGGTQIERAGRIRVAVRIRDIVVRDRAGAVVANAPKAEVKISTGALLTGRLRAQSLNLVGAELSIRIAQDGRVIVSTGDGGRPLATAKTSVPPAPGTISPAPASSPSAPPAAGQVSVAQPSTRQPPGTRTGMESVLAGLEWLDSLSETGLDGENLDEIGIKSGSLTVDDQRSGSRMKFENINLSLRRPLGGGIALSLSEEGKSSLKAVVGPTRNGVRTIQLDADKVPVQDIILAVRPKDFNYMAEFPLSGRIRGEIGRDGLPVNLTGKVSLGSGKIIDFDTPDYPMDIDAAEFNLEWDASRRVLAVPFHVTSGPNRVTLIAYLEPPNGTMQNWQLALSGGTILLGPKRAGEDPLVFNRIAVRFVFDTDAKKVVISKADFSNGDVSIAGSGAIDYSGEPRLAFGMAATPMSASVLRRVWPILIAPEVREWIIERVDRGQVQRMDVAVNSPIRNLSRSGPPIPEDGLSVNVTANGLALRPADDVPGLRDADLRARINGKTAVINIGQAQVDTPAGRKLTISDLVFEIPDLPAKPPNGRIRFKIDGPVPAAAEILTSDRLNEFSSGVPLDPNATKGNVSALVTLGFPIKRQLTKADTTYTINVDLGAFAADKLVMNQKLEGNALKIVANNQGYQVKGDVKIAGQPASIDYRKASEGDADVRLQATLDDASRARLGADLGSAVSGPIPVKVTGKLGSADRETKLGVEADLTAARIDNILPGWTKVAGKASRVVFNVVQKPQSTRIEDISIDGGPGVQIKGSLEIDQNGDVISANFPVFSPSEGDKSSLKADRAPDGSLRVVMRGDVFDARNLIKSALSGSTPDGKGKQKSIDIDIDLKMGAVAGNLGEAIRAVDLKLSRRAGVIRAFQLSGKIGRDSTLIGDIRGKAQGREVVYLETSDAGALFRFADIYNNMFGGKMWVAMDPPASDAGAQEGLLNVRDFTVKGEAALDRVVSNQNGGGGGIMFNHMRAEFTRQPGQLSIREGIVRGPIIGATIEGSINYVANQVRMSGTFVPMYGLNNMFGQIPIVGMVLGGGSNEGLIGITYEVVGTPGKPVLRVNPISAMAPGVLRKIFEFGTGKPVNPNDSYPSSSN